MAPERQIHYTLNFRKTSTPSSTTSSNKSDCSSGALELSIVGLPAPRRRTSNNNAAANNKPRTLKSAPIKNGIRTKPAAENRVDRPWTTSKRKILQNAWALEAAVQETPNSEVSLSKEKTPKSGRSVSSSSATISLCSVTASSAGDISSFEEDSNSQYSQAKSKSVSKKEPSNKYLPTKTPQEKFSFPVPAHVLKNELRRRALSDESSENETELKSLPNKELENLHVSEESVVGKEIFCLADIQEKVLELVENQQACSRQTWLVMQQLSATFDTLTKKSFQSEQKCLEFSQQTGPIGIPKPLPEPLLLKEAAGCALRLADILAMIGSSASPKAQQEKQAHVSSNSAPLKMFPATPADLLSQKEKLKPVPLSLGSTGAGLMEELNATLKMRRASIYQSDPELESNASEEWKE